MSAYDDWVVRFKVDTTELTKALELVNKLRTSMNGLYGAPSSGGGGRGRNSQPLTPQQEQAQRQRDFDASMRHLNHNQRLRERYEAAQAREFNARMKAIRMDQQRREAYRAAERRMANLEAQAYREDARRAAARSREMEQDRLRRQRASGAGESASASWARRRAEAINNLTAGNPASRDMRSYYSQMEARDAARRSALEQTRQVQLATMDAQARRTAERLAERQAAADLRSSNRSSNFNAAVETRRIRLDNLASRMGRYGVGDQTALYNIRQSLGAARNQTDLNALAPRMNEFVRATNQAISQQARLERQMQRNGFVVQSMSNSMANFARSYLSIYAGISGVQSLYKNAKEMENMQTKLLMGTGSRSEAASAFNYVKERAKVTGSDLLATTNLYSQLAITAKDAGMGKDQIKKVFEDTTTMSIGFGLGPDQQKLVTKAIVQMLSKQSVQAEEFDFRLAA